MLCKLTGGKLVVGPPRSAGSCRRAKGNYERNVTRRSLWRALCSRFLGTMPSSRCSTQGSGAGCGKERRCSPGAWRLGAGAQNFLKARGCTYFGGFLTVRSSHLESFCFAPLGICDKVCQLWFVLLRRLSSCAMLG